MPGTDIQPYGPSGSEIEALQPAGALGQWGGESAPPPAGPKLHRYVSALNRFKWLILLFTILGGGVGAAATRFLVPEYEVQSRILVQQGTGSRGGNGGGAPIRAAELFDKQSGFRELLTSYMVLDPVVTKLTLYLQPALAKDSMLFRNFEIEPSLRPGEYTLTVENSKWVLSRNPGVEVERGAVGDPIGTSAGFRWLADPKLLAGHSEIAFRVNTPRETSKELVKRLGVRDDDRSSFLLLTLSDPSASRAAVTLNTWVDQFVSVAAALKKKNISLSASILEGQRAYAAQELSATESALQSFRVQTVTEPNERQSVTPGIELTTNPAFTQYFNAKQLAENLQRDREALQRVVAEGKAKGMISREAVLSIPSVNADPSADQVRRSLTEQTDREFALRQLRGKFTDEYRDVRVAKEQLDTLRTRVVPQAIDAYLAQLASRETLVKADIDRSGKALKGIPVRSIEEQRLKRKVEVADALYRSIDVEAARAKLAEAQTIPDVSVTDLAVAPLTPSRNTAPMVLLAAIAGGLVIGLLVAIVLDQSDKRFRYPEQATEDMGLFILGVVPKLDGGGKKRGEAVSVQVVEAFRSIRMSVRYAADPARPLAVTITSPGPGDGKSLIASNLALSYAESGARTLLIDGDLRRGELSKTFQIPSRPGLVEYLDGTALTAEVLYPFTAHPNLTLMPSGARRKRAPELLATPRLTQLIAQMSAEYDVVIVDSPPLGAGFDAFALATATGNMAMVLRAGVTDRKLAASKLSVVHTLPIRVLGAVLNSIKMKGVYEYYSYYQDYAAHDEDTPVLPESTRGASRSVDMVKA